MSDDWHRYLEPGETLLWQGRPDGSLVFVWRHAVEAILSLGFAFGVVMLIAMMVLLPLSLTTLAFVPGLVFFAGLASFLGPWPHLRDARRRRGTRYALTDRRAIIARADRNGRVALRSFPIGIDSPIGTAWDSVTFAKERRHRGGRSRDVYIGFERLGDQAKRVHDHLLAIKAAAPLGSRT